MIRVSQDFSHGVTVYRYDNVGEGVRSYWTHDGKRKNVKEGETPPWWIVLDYGDATALAAALSDNAPPKPSYLEGELKATKLHLSDMRKLAMMEPAQEEA